MLLALAFGGLVGFTGFTVVSVYAIINYFENVMAVFSSVLNAIVSFEFLLGLILSFVGCAPFPFGLIAIVYSIIYIFYYGIYWDNEKMIIAGIFSMCSTIIAQVTYVVLIIGLLTLFVKNL